ncbi:hypothetical protein DRN69_08390 [Candidatus Pacearchaeota archaeon]|nr:MAG: hypothetical protein DRN69_08390 [Candidatus Pacearchaeota archaeon]
MATNFTQKEMLIRMMDKLDKIEERMNETHELAKTTNGKVKLHTKLITGLGGAMVVIIGWIIAIILK